MKGIKVLVLLLIVVASVRAQSSGKFEKVASVKGIKATVKVLNETMVTLTVDTAPNQRYVAPELPAELKKDGLHLTIDGDIGAIPPNVRMIGTPFRITCIHVSAAEKKKYKLSKKTWCMKSPK